MKSADAEKSSSGDIQRAGLSTQVGASTVGALVNALMDAQDGVALGNRPGAVRSGAQVLDFLLACDLAMRRGGVGSHTQHIDEFIQRLPDRVALIGVVRAERRHIAMLRDELWRLALTGDTSTYGRDWCAFSLRMIAHVLRAAVLDNSKRRELRNTQALLNALLSLRSRQAP